MVASTYSSVMAILAVALFQSAIAAPVPIKWPRMAENSPHVKREVPQEHSHEPIVSAVRAILQNNNPNNLPDPIFGLLGNVAAKGAAPNIDPECLQQELADQAFTNAKGNKDTAGMTAALQFRALERNTGAVGLQSNSCTSVTAQNPEIAVVHQHQDPASDGAAATNKEIVLALAKEINAIGGNATDALATGTFPAGEIGDPTAKGFTCDVEGDPLGCIVSQHLLVLDATPDEIAAAIGGASSGSTTTTSSSSTDAAASSTSAGTKGATPSSSSSNTGATDAASSSADVNASFGDCPPPEIEGGLGFDGRTEFSFQPANKTAYNHGSAQGIQIITQFMCDTLVNECGLKSGDPGHTLCEKAEAATGSGKDDGGLADKFNAFFGLKTNFADAPGSRTATDAASSGTATSTSGGAATSSSAASGAASSASDCSSGEAASAGSSSAGSSSSGTSSASSSGSQAATSGTPDLGSCSNPEIEFGLDFDGRTEASFRAVNQKDFDHGSTDAIGITASFICQRLGSPCNAPQATIDVCTKAATAAQAQSGGSAADTFNAAFNIQTNFASDPANASSSGSAPASASASTSAAPASDPAATASSPSSPSSSSSGADLQTFTGELGGLPPAVTAGGPKGFQTDNDSFVGLATALGRSCDVQHNKCANQANAGGASFSVSDCDEQNNECHADIPARLA